MFFLDAVTGDPITAALGGRLTADQLAERIHAAGYDRPLLVQYSSTSADLLHGDFGTTISDNRPVTEVLTTYGAATLELAFYALIVAFARRHPVRPARRLLARPWPDAVLRVFAILCYATPVFFAGLLLKLVFSVWLGWLPVAGRASTGAEIQLQTLRQPHRHLPDRRDPLGDREVIADVLAARRAAGGRARACSPPASSCGWCAPTSSARWARATSRRPAPAG